MVDWLAPKLAFKLIQPIPIAHSMCALLITYSLEVTPQLLPIDN